MKGGSNHSDGDGFRKAHRLSRQDVSLIAASLLAGAALLLYFAHAGLGTYLSGDDLMNIQHMHGFFTKPYWQAALDVLNPVTTAYRPLGGLFYRTLYPLAGFHPLPYRSVCFGLILLNLGLTGYLIRTISGDAVATSAGVLLFSYNAALAGIYFNTGTVYDILCCTLSLCTLLYYLLGKPSGGKMRPQRLFVLLLLDLLALQSKEMAWTLPAIIFLYEIIYWPREKLRRMIPCACMALLTIGSMLPRLLGHTALSASPAYKPVLTPAYFLRSAARFWGLLFYAPGKISPAILICIWIVIILVALLLRSRSMVWGLLFWIVAIVPVALIPDRGGFVSYFPMIGLALCGGALAARLRPASLPAAPLLAALFCALLVADSYGQARIVSAPEKEQSYTRALVAQLKQLHPRLKPQGQVLFVDDPYGPDNWILPFVFRLLYNDPEIWVDRTQAPNHVHAYDYVFRFSDGVLTEFPARAAHCPAPLSGAGFIDDLSPQLCWSPFWLTESFGQADGGTVTHSNREGCTVSITFAGTSLTYIYTRAFNRGMVQVTIDGNDRGIIDLYDRRIVPQASTAFSGLGTGQHTAELRVLGRHRRNAVDSIVDVDGFVVQ